MASTSAVYKLSVSNVVAQVHFKCFASQQDIFMSLMPFQRWLRSLLATTSTSMACHSLAQPRRSRWAAASLRASNVRMAHPQMALPEALLAVRCCLNRLQTMTARPQPHHSRVLACTDNAECWSPFLEVKLDALGITSCTLVPCMCHVCVCIFLLCRLRQTWLLLQQRNKCSSIVPSGHIRIGASSTCECHNRMPALSCGWHHVWRCWANCVQ
jgi:hypothetical protein